MLTPRENARRAVRFQTPEYMPVLYVNRDLERSDFRTVGFGHALDFAPDTPGRDEYGYVWVRMDDTMGQPAHPPLEEWDRYYNYRMPSAEDPARYAGLEASLAEKPDLYHIASVGISGFNQYTFLRGFENAMEDIYLEPRRMTRLMGDIVDFECGLVRHFLEYDVDAVMFGDDWGTQNALMIDPCKWRELFLPFYKKQFAMIRDAGKDVFFHSCGQVMDILPDLVDAGVSCLNLNQPDIFPFERLARELRGQVCFLCPVDHQTVAIRGSEREIYEYAHKLRRELGTSEGGFIANIEEYHSVGMTPERYAAICGAFEEMRREPWGAVMR